MKNQPRIFKILGIITGGNWYGLFAPVCLVVIEGKCERGGGVEARDYKLLLRGTFFANPHRSALTHTGNEGAFKNLVRTFFSKKGMEENLLQFNF